jgi:hypothetical protein
LIVPVAGVFRCDPGYGRLIPTVYTALGALTGFGTFVLSLFGSWALAAAGVLLVVFAIGWVFYA